MTSSLQAFSALWLTEVAIDVLQKLPTAVRESVLQTKQEQTFSSLIASKINSEFLTKTQNIALVEIRGKSTSNKQRNTHDIALLNESGRKLCIIENKVWYHFDGAKGRRKPTVEKNVLEQLELDIQKIQITLQDQKDVEAIGFVLIHLVTPHEMSMLPRSYKKSLESALKREKGSIPSMIESGLNGTLKALDQFKQELHPFSSSNTNFPETFSRVDVICAQVRRSKFHPERVFI